jgi:ABC-type uncharacterized transport system fused permease/ATPase subunit
MTLFSRSATDDRRLALFWQASRRYWLSGRASVIALVGVLLGVVLLQLVVQFFLNRWNRHFFDALEQRNATALWTQALLFVPLAFASIALAATSVWGRMTTQRRWREAMTRDIIRTWSRKSHALPLTQGAEGADNPEYRLAEDVRVATDAPVDLTLAFVSSGLTALTFFGVLWNVGGSLTVELFGRSLLIPGYLVLGVVAYSTVMTSLMLWFGRRMSGVIERRNQAEAEFRASAEIFRGDRVRTQQDAVHGGSLLLGELRGVLRSWRELCWQLVSTTLVSHGNFLFAPVAAYFLCVPKYLNGAMTLGEVTQSAAAFVTVQGAVNWLVDNYQRLADWRSSAHRVAALLLVIDSMPDVEPAKDDAAKD